LAWCLPPPLPAGFQNLNAPVIAATGMMPTNLRGNLVAGHERQQTRHVIRRFEVNTTEKQKPDCDSLR
jgi:hypothetical protein